jgi:hypothetical protein
LIQQQVIFYATRISLVGVMLLLNSIMLNFLVHSMRALGSAKATTIINAFSFALSVCTMMPPAAKHQSVKCAYMCIDITINTRTYDSHLLAPFLCIHVHASVCQGILGHMCFGEAIALQWWFGLGIILCGVGVISADNANDCRDSMRSEDGAGASSRLETMTDGNLKKDDVGKETTLAASSSSSNAAPKSLGVELRRSNRLLKTPQR